VDEGTRGGLSVVKGTPLTTSKRKRRVRYVAESHCRKGGLRNGVEAGKDRKTDCDAAGLSVRGFQVFKLPHQGTAGAEFLGYQQKENPQDRIREFTKMGHERITTCARIREQLPAVNPGYFAYFRTVGTDELGGLCLTNAPGFIGLRPA
jgi:hypothetical protein